MIKNSQNIFIILARGIWNFFKVGIFAIFSLLFLKKIDTIPQKFSFFAEIFEKWPKWFFSFPTGIRLGRAIFAPILFLFAQKNDNKDPSQKP